MGTTKPIITFHDDLDILHIDDSVVKILQGWMKDRDRLVKEHGLYSKIAANTHNPIDEIEAKQRIKKILIRLAMIDSGRLVEDYILATSSIIKEYINISGGSRVFGIDQCVDIPKRIGLILRFLDIVTKYLDIRWSCTYDITRICPRCYGPMKRCSTIMVCEKCNYSRLIPPSLQLYVDLGKSKANSTYDSSKNYRKEYMHLCGLQHDMGPNEIDDITSYLYRASVKNITRDDIRDAIKATGYNNYRDTNLIYSLITNTPLPSIEAYADQCTERFREYSETFHTLEIKEGTNITNIHFLTKLFLWQEGIAYDESWFRTLSPVTEAKHRRNIRRVCSILEKQGTKRWPIPPSWT